MLTHMPPVPGAAADSMNPQQRWLVFRCIPALVGAGLLLLLLTAALEVRAAETAAALPFAIDGGQLLYLDATGGTYTPAVLQQSTVDLDVTGMVATVRLEQSFRNDSDGWVEGVYAFPLPDAAAVRAMEMIVGDRVIRSEIKEKQAAREIYRKATKAGKKASLVERQRPNLFTNRVANIGPGETVTVRLEYLEIASYRHGVFSLRFPMTITARYIPGAVPQHEPGATLSADPYQGWARPTDQVPDANAVTPRQWPGGLTGEAPLNPVSITGRIAMGLPMQLLESAYHEITLARQDNDYRFELAAGTVEMDRDFVLSWQPVTGREPEAAVFTETTAEDSFALVMVMPPVLAATGDGAGDQAIAREMIFVIDTSGSMGGTPIQQARQSLAWALRQLGPRDYFNIIEFSSTPRALHSGAVPASRHYLQQAQEFVRQLNAGGGTEMSAALSLALRDTHSSADRPVVRQVVFITDGAVGNEAALFEQISRDLDDSRLFTVGIGSAPNSWFMRKAAQFGRGSYTFIGRQDEVGDRMQELFTQLASPVVTDIALRWSGDTRVESFPARIPDLYRGEPLLIAARLGAGSPGAGELQVSGLLGGSSWQRDLRYDLVAQEGAVQQGAVQQGAVQQGPGQAAGVATLWARSKIADLLDQKVMGRPEQQVRSAVLEVALKHRLASPYTSFVAVEERISRPQQTTLDSRAVPNTQPQGQAPQPYAWPTTATSAPGSTLLGSLLLFIALMTFVMRQPEVNHAPAV